MSSPFVQAYARHDKTRDTLGHFVTRPAGQPGSSPTLNFSSMNQITRLEREATWHKDGQDAYRPD